MKVTGKTLCLILLGLGCWTSAASAQSPGTFKPTGSMSMPRVGHTATLLADGRVLIAGGYTDGVLSTLTATAEVYDPATARFTKTGSMTSARGYHTAVLLPDGRVLIVGGSGGRLGGIGLGDMVRASAELYDPATGTFSDTGQMTTSSFVGYTTTTLLSDGRVVIAGLPFAVDLFDPSKGTITATATPAIGNISVSTTLLPDGRVFFGSDPGVVYDPRSGTLSLGSSFKVPSRMTLLANGQVLGAGGFDDYGPVSGADLYDPSTGVVTETGSMAAGRADHTMTLLPDGRALVTGGMGMGDPIYVPLGSAELYDPVTGVFINAGMMTTSRSGHTATLLNNGQVLIAGGTQSASHTLSFFFNPPAVDTDTAELYVPAASVPPSIGVDKTSLLFTTVMGQQATKTIGLTASGGGGLQWSVVTLAPWLRVTPVIGIGSGNIRVTADTANLSPGTYNTNVTIMAPASNTPVVIPVTFTIVPGCPYSLNAAGDAFSAAGGPGSVIVTTPDACQWTVSNGLSWITLGSVTGGSGTGIVTFQAMPNTGAARLGTFSVAGISFTVEQQPAFVSGLNLAGSSAQIATGGDWNTSFTLINTDTTVANVRFNFFDDNGNPLAVPLAFPQNSSGPLLAATLDRTIAPNATLVIDTAGLKSDPVQAGSLQLLTDGNISAFSLYRWNLNNEESAAPMETRDASAYLLSFDNTNGSLNGEAIANLAAQAFAIPVVIRDDTGAVLRSTSIPLVANGHSSFLLNVLFPETANKRGTVEFDTPAGGRITVVELQFEVSGAFSTVPILAK